MISWQKPGQKVACLRSGWTHVIRGLDTSGPAEGDVCTIGHVETTDWGPALALVEWPGGDTYIATAFRPVYPTIIDQLRKLDAPSPKKELIKEKA